MTTVISVENLGKKYLLSHQAQRQPYVALRDVIAERTAALGRKLLHPFRNSSLITHHPSQEEFWALKDVSFEIKQGDRVGIIGRNGAGKSTLLKILSRIVEPTTGRVRIKGRVASLLEVGTGFHPELTGRENIFLNGAILGMTKAEIRKKFDEIVDFSGVERFLDTPVKRYSSGMYVRLAFAVAAHLEPEILIVDEVLSVGDAAFQQRCLGKMKQVSTEGRTVLFVSHNLPAVRLLCEDAILLEKGLVMAQGETGHVLNQYSKNISGGYKLDRPQRISGDKGRGDNFYAEVSYHNRQLSIDCGEQLVLKIKIFAPTPMKHLTAGLNFYSNDERPVLSMSSKVQSVKSICGPSLVWSIEVDCGSLPLNADEYQLRLYIGDEYADLARFSDLLRIDVQAKDVFGWGAVMPGVQDWGHVYWAPIWEITPIAAH